MDVASFSEVVRKTARHSFPKDASVDDAVRVADEYMEAAASALGCDKLAAGVSAAIVHDLLSRINAGRTVLVMRHGEQQARHMCVGMCAYMCGY